MSEVKHFGTDGIRGQVGQYPITADFLVKLGWAVSQVLPKHAKVLIGKDTRISGYMIESALEAGLSAGGANVCLLGPMPTPAVAYLTRSFQADLGIVISASHNHYNDNGIKFFSEQGYKISKIMEEEIEANLKKPIVTKDSSSLGKAERIHDASGRYIEFCKSTIPHFSRLSSIKMVVDCANGATYHIAPHVFEELGAQVIPINDKPNGLNINENGGSTNPAMLRECVLVEKADLGVAFDGDGDRLVLVDEKGEILNGDEILYIIVKGLIESKRFAGGIVGTEMTNLGFEQAVNDLGVAFVRVPVGDQNVIKELVKRKWLIGGESSGHLVDLHVSTASDAIVSALNVLYIMSLKKCSLNALKHELKLYPQKTANIAYSKKISLDKPEVLEILEKAKAVLGNSGRVLVRYSGTEPVLRITVEGNDTNLVNSQLSYLADAFSKLLKQTTHAT